MIAWPLAFNVPLAITGLPLTDWSTMFTVPVGTPPELVTVTVRVVSVVVIWLLEVEFGQVCVLACAVMEVDVALPGTARATGISAKATRSPATQDSRKLRQYLPITCTCSKLCKEIA